MENGKVTCLYDNGLISANNTEEEIFEEILVAEGVSQQTQVQIEEGSNEEKEEPIRKTST